MFTNYFQEIVKETCKKFPNNKCPYWIDDDIFVDLQKLDRIDGGDRADRYFKQCHTPEAIIQNINDKWVCRIQCRLNNIHAYTLYDKCPYQNEHAATEILERLQEADNP